MEVREAVGCGWLWVFCFGCCVVGGGVGLAALLLAAWACTFPSDQPDAAATVSALSTALRQPVEQPTTPAAGAAPSGTPVASSLPTTQPTEFARAGSPVLHARRLASSLDVSADVALWGQLPYSAAQVVYRPENWTGNGDLGLQFGLGWDAGYLYVAAVVSDDVHAQSEHGAAIYTGDSLEVLLDADLGGDFDAARLDGDDYQLGISPGAAAGGTPEAYLWFPSGRAGAPEGVRMGAHLLAPAGYALQAAIPWSLFGLSPAEGRHFGFALSVSDNDAATAQQQTMISSAPARLLTNPTTWGTLALDE